MFQRGGWWRVAALAMLVAAPFLAAAPHCGGGGPTLHGIYVLPTVVHEGESAALRVSTLNDMVPVTVQDAVSGDVVFSANVDGRAQATHANAHIHAGWARAETLPALPAGVYTVSIPANSLPQGEISFSGGLNFEAPLLVRPAAPSGDVLLVLDDATWQAYNRFGGFSYYTDPPTQFVGRRRSGANRVAKHFVSRLAKELDGLGIPWDVADTDYIEDHPGLLGAYRLVVLVHKFEYMTRTFRDALQAYFDGGGRIFAPAFELAVFQARRNGDLWTCFKYPHRGTDPVLLDAEPANDDLATYEWARTDPETRLFGTSYWLGGRAGTPSSWTVHRAGHWLWNGTGLHEGGALVPLDAFDLVDGTLLRFVGGLPYPDQTGLTETPADFLVLASVPTVTAVPWWCWIGGTPRPQCEQPGHGVMGIRQNANGGIVLVIPDTDWLIDSKWLAHPQVPQVTRNALQVLAAPGPVDAYGGYSPQAP